MYDNELIAAIDGPLAGQWWTWADWMARVQGPRWMLERHGVKAPTLLYRPAGYQVPHPHREGVHGWAVVSRARQTGDD